MRPRGIRTALAVLATMTPLLFPVHATASPLGIALVIQANGSFAPGLPTVGCAYQYMTFDGVAVAAGDESGAYPVSFSGASDTCESLASGSGRGTMSGGLSGPVAYTRTGNQIAVSGEVKTSDNTVKTIVTGACVAVVTFFNPVAGFAMFCVWQLKD